MKKTEIKIGHVLLLMLGYLCLSGINGQARISEIDSLNRLLENPLLKEENKFYIWEQIGEAHANRFDAVQAAKAYEEAIRIGRKHAYLLNFSKALFSFGQMKIYAGNYQEAMPALSEALSLAKERKDLELEARVLTSFGILHFFQQRWDDALFYYRQALELAEKIEEPQGISIAYNNIANIYQKKESLDTALIYYNRALTIQRNIPDSASIGNCLMNIGTIQLIREQIPESLRSFQEALAIASAIGDYEIEALSYMHLGQAYAKQKAFSRAFEMLYRGEKIASQTGYKQVLLEILESSSELYRQTGDFQKAFEQLRRSRHLGDSLMNQHLKEKTKEFDIQYKTAEKDAELAIQKKDLEQAKVFHLLLSIISILLISLVLFLVYSAKQRRKQNKRLSELNATKDKLFSIISHDLKSPVAAQKVAVEHMLENFEMYDEQQFLHSLREFQRATEVQLELLQNLLNWARVQVGQIKYHPVIFDLSEVVKEILGLYALPARNKNILFQNRITEPCMVVADRPMIHTVLRNLINNAIKFSNPGKTITFSVVSENHSVMISVKDAGIGMTKEQIHTVLNTKQHMAATTGTQGEKGSGLGLVICRELLEQNNSQMNIHSETGEGTEVSFSLLSPEG